MNIAIFAGLFAVIVLAGWVYCIDVIQNSNKVMVTVSAEIVEFSKQSVFQSTDNQYVATILLFVL